MTSNNFYVCKTANGRGIFANSTFIAGDIIETAPVIVINTPNASEHLDKTTLGNYYFMWDEPNIALALGYISLYNHSYSPNATYIFGEDNISIMAIKKIEPHTEIFVNYNGDPECKDKLWFDVKI